MFEVPNKTKKRVYVHALLNLIKKPTDISLDSSPQAKKLVTVLHLFNADPARKRCGYFSLRQLFLFDLFSDATHLPNHTINNCNLYLTEIRMRIYYI
ncbi:hypothetical protein CON64_13155 [Bacillus pseudomycoides]|nr:hypothetical protein CON64_13155 [Bacillus pseudomycoides]